MPRHSGPKLHPSSLPSRSAADPQMDALMELLQAAPAEAADLFSNSLELLVSRLGMDLALMTRKSDLGWEVFWWATRKDFNAGDFIDQPVGGLSQRVMDWSRRTLVVRDAQAEAAWDDVPEVRDRGIRSFVGAPLWEAGLIIGTLGVQSAYPRDFNHAEVALVAAVDKLISKTLEIEDLKSQLRLTREALELSSAVLEDSSLHNPASGLPNLRYLEVWLKANLTLARRNREPMPLVLLVPASGETAPEGLKALGETLRGVDLMVDRGDGSLLLLLPGTPKEGVPQLLERLSRLSPAPFRLSATVWDPLRDDLELRSALKRLKSGREAGELSSTDPMVLFR